MGRYSNAIALRDAQQRRFRAMGMDARRGHQDLAIQGLGDMQKLTRGGLSSRTLKRMGHPYARAASNPQSGLYNKARGSRLRVRLNGRKLRVKAPLLPINLQTGRLHRSMRLKRTTGGVQAFNVGPDASAGPSIHVLRPGGTKRMVARGFWAEVKKRWRARSAAWVQEFVRKQRRTY